MRLRADAVFAMGSFSGARLRGRAMTPVRASWPARDPASTHRSEPSQGRRHAIGDFQARCALSPPLRGQTRGTIVPAALGRTASGQGADTASAAIASAMPGHSYGARKTVGDTRHPCRRAAWARGLRGGRARNHRQARGLTTNRQAIGSNAGHHAAAIRTRDAIRSRRRSRIGPVTTKGAQACASRASAGRAGCRLTTPPPLAKNTRSPTSR